MRALLAIAMVAFLTHPVLAQEGDRSLRTANGLLDRGLHAEAAAEYTIALRSLDDAAARDEARYGLAMAHYSLGNDAAALRALGDLETGSRFAFRADADVLRAYLLFRQKDYARAADAAQTAVAHRDHAAWTVTAALLIESLHRAGKHEDATKAYADLADSLQRDNESFRRASFFAGLSQSAIARRAPDHGRAAEWFERAIPRQGHDDLGDLAMLQQAGSLQRAGDPAAAISAYEHTISRGGERTKPDAMLQLATLLRTQHRSGEAANLLRTLADESPRYQPARVQYELGLTLLDIDEPADAARAFDRAERHAHPELADDIAYWRSKADLRGDHPAAAAKRLATALEQFPQSSLAAEMRYDRAVALQRAGASEEAAHAFGVFLSAHPDHAMAPDALYAQASLALEAGDLDRAATLADRFTNSYAGHPLRANAAFLRGEAAYRAGDYASSSRSFATLTDIDDATLAQQARYRLGMSLHALGRTDEATPYLTAVTGGASTQPEFLPALFILADIAFDAGRWNDAERMFGQYASAAGREGPSADAATMKLALAQLRQDHTEQAVRTLESLLSTWPNGEHAAHAMFELGQARVSLGDDRDAQAMFTQLLERYGDSRFAPHALRHLAAIAARRGDADRAASLYAQAAERGGAELAGDIAIDRARALINAGRPEEAATLLRNGEGPATAWHIIALSRAGEHARAVRAADGYQPADLSTEESGLYQYALATSARETGDTDRAAALLERLTGSKTTVAPNAALDLADLRIAGKDFTQAADLLGPIAIAKDLDPQLRDAAAYKAAWARYQLGEHRAVVQLLKGREMGELGGASSMLLGESLLVLKRGREAAEQFGAALSAPGDSVDADAALLRLGEAHAVAQDWRNSERAYQRHRTEHAKSPRWYMAEFGIGWALENAGKQREAIDHYRAVADKHKGDTAARAQFQLGECLFALGEHEAAVRELLRVDILHASPTWSAAALYEAGRCFEAIGKVGEARAQYRAVQERFAQSDWATAAGERLAAISGPGGGRPGRGG